MTQIRFKHFLSKITTEQIMIKDYFKSGEIFYAGSTEYLKNNLDFDGVIVNIDISESRIMEIILGGIEKINEKPKLTKYACMCSDCDEPAVWFDKDNINGIRYCDYCFKGEDIIYNKHHQRQCDFQKCPKRAIHRIRLKGFCRKHYKLIKKQRK